MKNSFLIQLWAIRRYLICWFGPLVWSPLLFISTPEAKCAYVVLLMITYWFTEVIPMAITSLIPVVLFPLLQIVSSEEIAKSYCNGTIMVFLGSLIAASAVKKSNLHERIALKVILLTGTSPKRLFLGFMATTAFLSMWISNLATVALMLPIVNAALEQLTRRQSISYPRKSPESTTISGNPVYITMDNNHATTTTMMNGKANNNNNAIKSDPLNRIKTAANNGFLLNGGPNGNGNQNYNDNSGTRRTQSLNNRINYINDNNSSNSNGNGNIANGTGRKFNMMMKRTSSTASSGVTQSVLSRKQSKKLRKGILLGICYASNIGGTGTLTGTSTNLVLNGFLKDDPISFSDWFFFNVPGLIILVICSWLFLTTIYVTNNKKKKIDTKENEKRIYETLKFQYDQLGNLSFHEGAVLTLFALLLSLWFFRSPDFIPGWTRLFIDPNPNHSSDEMMIDNNQNNLNNNNNNRLNYIKDSMPTMFVVLLFFMIPANPFQLKRSSSQSSQQSSSEMLLDWKTTQEKVSWSVFLLLGGGFAMAKGCELSGLSVLIGSYLKILEQLPQTLIILIMCSIGLILTELISNTAAITILLPVLNQMSIHLQMNPLIIMLPVTVGCSYAFMLPFSSGTNAIIFEAGKMKTKDMLIPGFFMKIICLLILMIMTHTWGRFIFDLNPPMPIPSSTTTTTLPTSSAISSISSSSSSPISLLTNVTNLI